MIYGLSKLNFCNLCFLVLNVEKTSVIIKLMIRFNYFSFANKRAFHKVASSNTSNLEASASFFILLEGDF